MFSPNTVTVPFRGAKTTAAAIRSAALESQNHYTVRELAEKICEGIQPRDYVSEYLAILNFVSANMRYMRDPKKRELVKKPHLLVAELNTGHRPQGDCDDESGLICALLLAVGATVRIVCIAFKNHFYAGERQYSHVFCQAQDPRTGTWITLDPVAGRSTRKMLREGVAVKIWPVT